MKKITKIMVAYDFSEYSKEALQYAAELAKDLNADLIVANVINQRDVNAVKYTILFSNAVSEEKYVKYQTEKRSRRIKELMEETSFSHLPIKKVFRIGIPFYELIQVIQDEGADLVVMGPKGRSNLKGILFGATAEKMFRYCPVPLLSIRTNQRKSGGEHVQKHIGSFGRLQTS